MFGTVQSEKMPSVIPLLSRIPLMTSFSSLTDLPTTKYSPSPSASKPRLTAQTLRRLPDQPKRQLDMWREGRERHEQIATSERQDKDRNREKVALGRWMNDVGKRIEGQG